MSSSLRVICTGLLTGGGGELGFEVAHGARADDRRGDRGVAPHERERELDQREAGLLSKLGQRVGGGELALVGGVAQIEAVGGASRGGRPLRFGVLAVAPREPAAG
ncbi:MAG TPA: hypothetical protein VGF91_17475 [Solirubrobacteraceae bacterium]